MFQKVTMTLIAFFSCVNVYAWGAKGHQIIAYTGGNLATSGQAFWQANLQPLRQLTTVPDRVWKAGGNKINEGHMHWFQVDAYYTPANYDQIINFPNSYGGAVDKFTEDTIIINGTAPWRIRQLYQLALGAFKAGDMKSGLQFVGTLTHYVGDLSQPLHASENFDGQQTGNKGIHAYFEATIIKDEIKIRDDVQKRAANLLKDQAFLNQFKGNLMQSILFEIKRSIEKRDQILKNDSQFGRSAKGAAAQLELAKDRMADGAATLALILNRLWAESGLVAQATPMTIQDPEWVRPDFGTLPLSLEHDDCSM